MRLQISWICVQVTNLPLSVARAQSTTFCLRSWQTIRYFLSPTVIPANSRQLTAQKLDGSVNIPCMVDRYMGVTFYSFSELIYPCPQAFPMLALSPGPSLPKRVLVLTVHTCTKFPLYFPWKALCTLPASNTPSWSSKRSCYYLHRSHTCTYTGGHVTTYTDYTHVHILEVMWLPIYWLHTCTLEVMWLPILITHMYIEGHVTTYTDHTHMYIYWRSCDYVYWYFDLDKIVVYMLVVTSLSVVRNKTIKHVLTSGPHKAECTHITYLLRNGWPLVH